MEVGGLYSEGVCVCDLSGCEAQVRIGCVEETAAVYIVRHCRRVVSTAGIRQTINCQQF